MIWNALFSQTGSEIYHVSKLLGKFPTRIVTNKPFEDISSIHEGLRKEFPGIWVFLPKKPSAFHYCDALGIPTGGSITTLHGYLRIIPPLVCEGWKIFNGHPGDIIKYPELKGFNPQEKAFNLKLPTSGSVIHEVTAGVDEGPIVAHQEISIEGLYLDQVYSDLHKNSIDLWYKFLQSKL